MKAQRTKIFPTDESRAAVGNVLGEQLLGAIERTMGLMEIAEAEIASAKRQWPGKSAEIHAAFRFLQPFALVRCELLYRLHCREIIERVRLSQPVEPATKAEVLHALSELSLRAMPNERAVALFIALFAELVPDKVEWPLKEEPWKGSNAELLAELRQKLARNNRDCRG